jgi:hypothetical protein
MLQQTQVATVVPSAIWRVPISIRCCICGPGWVTTHEHATCTRQQT